MAAKFSQAAKIGLFVVITAGAGYLVYNTIHKSTGSGGGYVVHAYIKDASGIAKHSRVTIAGIPVGSVEDIRLENGKARESSLGNRLEALEEIRNRSVACGVLLDAYRDRIENALETARGSIVELKQLDAA